jgi:hypothetical protein
MNLRAKRFGRRILEAALVAIFGASLAGCAKDAVGVQSSFVRSNVAPRGEFERIAVLDFEGAGGPAFADLVAQELMKAKYTAVERSALHAAIGELELGAADNESLNLDALRNQLGGVLLARVLIVGALVERTDALSPGKNGATGASGLLATCRAIDPKTGQVLWTGAVKAGAAIANGEFAGPLTAWRLAAQEIVRAYKENGYKGQSIAFEAERIPR